MNKKGTILAGILIAITLTTILYYPKNIKDPDQKTTTLNLQLNEEKPYLDISHRYYSEITLKKGKTAYLRLIFNLAVENVDDNAFILCTIPADEDNAGTAFEVEVDKLPTGCSIGTKYILLDTWGEGDENVLQFAVVARLQAGTHSWTIVNPKITVNNLLLHFLEEVEHWKNPLISLEVDEALLTEAKYIKWENSLESPTLDPVIIGVILPNSWWYHDEYTLLVERAEEDINAYCAQEGYDIRFKVLFENAHGSPQVHLEKVHLYDSLGVKLLLGGFMSGQASESLDYVNENNMLLLSPSSTSPTLATPDDNLFRLVPHEGYSASVLAHVVRSKGKDAVVFIQKGEDWIVEDYYNAFEDTFGELEGEVLGRIIYHQDELNVVQCLVDADVILNENLGKYSIGQMAIVLTGFEETLWFLNEAYDNPVKYPNVHEVTWFGWEGNVNMDDVINYAPEAGDHFKLYSPVSVPDEEAVIEYEWLYDWYQDITDEPLHMYGACTYDILWLYAHSVIETRSTDAETIKGVLPAIAEGYSGASGEINLDENGDRWPVDYNILGYGYDNGVPSSIIYGRYDYYNDPPVDWD